MNRFIGVIAFIFLAAAIAWLAWQQQSLTITVARLQQQADSLAAAPKGEADLLAYMNKYQRFADKLHAAGTAANWQLAEFYVHELEENTESLIAADLTEDGLHLSSMARKLILPAIEQLDSAIDARSQPQFAQNYTLMLAACNSCHATAKHEYIRIIPPQRSSFTNQDFAPQAAPVQMEYKQ